MFDVLCCDLLLIKINVIDEKSIFFVFLTNYFKKVMSFKRNLSFNESFLPNYLSFCYPFADPCVICHPFAIRLPSVLGFHPRPLYLFRNKKNSHGNLEHKGMKLQIHFIYKPTFKKKTTTLTGGLLNQEYDVLVYNICQAAAVRAAREYTKAVQPLELSKLPRNNNMSSL